MLTATVVAVALACGQSPDLGADLSGGTGGRPGDSSGGSETGSGDAGGAPASGGLASDDLDVTPTGGGGTTSGGNGVPEVCDGVDNDLDGEVDNVDAGGDGLCDCLVVGTVGAIGPWGNGSNIFVEWLNSRSPNPAVVLGDAELTDETLSGINVLVVLRADTNPLDYNGLASPAHHAFGDGEIAALERWVQAGGGLLTTIGYQGDEASEVVNVNSLLEPYGVGYSTENFNLNNGLVEWNDAHPSALGISDIYTDNGAVVVPGSGTAVAYDASGQVGMAAQEVELGHVIVFGDEWITYDSEWEGNAQVELLWLNMLRWLSPAKQCQVSIPPELFE